MMSYLVQHFLENAAQRKPDKIALICGDQRLTYGQVNEQSDRLACRLEQSGVKRQDRVAILLDNSVESVIALFGVLKAGGIFIMLSATMKARKLSYILSDSAACVLITHRGKTGDVLESVGHAGALENIIWVGAAPEQVKAAPDRIRHLVWQNLPGDGAVVPPQAGRRSIDRDLAAIIYTSGSTGEPKGVMCAHCNMVAAAESITHYIENTADDIIMNVLPLSFDYGLYQVLMAFLWGATVVLEKSFLFPVRILEMIQKERVTGFPIVPTMATLLLQMENIGRFDLSSLRYITNTAAVLPTVHIRKLRELFPAVKIFSMYGLTECKRVSWLPPDQLDTRPASVGIPMCNEEVFIVDANGREAAPGQVGELVIRGANVMPGYWNAPEETAKRFKAGMYPGEFLLYSGDLFKQDDEGFLYFIARKDDMIKTRGERVSPREIEAVLLEMEGVADAAVVGLPDEVLGQAIKAFIVRNAKGDITEQAVRKHCLGHLESFMMPKYIEFTRDFPKNASGKIDKKKLCQSGRSGVSAADTNKAGIFEIEGRR